MTTAQGFTPDDRLFCIEHLTPEARERLGFYYCDKYGEWRHQDRTGHCGIDFCEYLHDAAILAEVVIELVNNGWEVKPAIDHDGSRAFKVRKDVGYMTGSHRVISYSFPSFFTAAAAAYHKCKVVGK